MAEYIDREMAIDFAKHASYKGLNVVEYLEEVPAADVIKRPEGITAERMAEIIRAEIEGRLKIKAPPLEETCGSCKHFHPYVGMSTGKCDCRVKLDRHKRPTTEALYVTQSRKRCRDDYEPRAEQP